MGGVSRRIWVTAVLALVGASSVCSALAATGASWTGLGDGQVGQYLWSVKAKRQGGEGGSGPAAAERPCLLIGTTWELGPYSFRRSKYRNCVDPAGRIASTEPPLIATAVQPTSGKLVKMTAVGMIFPASARRARVTLSDGHRTTIELERLSSAEAHAAGLGHLRYAAFAVRGRWCPKRVVSQDARGRVLWDSGDEAYVCGIQQPAMMIARAR